MERLLFLAVLMFLTSICHSEFYINKAGVGVVSQYWSGSPGERASLSAGSHVDMMIETGRRGIFKPGVYPPSTGYDMRERGIYAHEFHNLHEHGRIILKFMQYDLNPNSLIYIYDGANSSARGSLWTHKSYSPVYASTGRNLYFVFKIGTGTVNKYIGIRVRAEFVYHIEPNELPSTGVCAPFRNSSEGWWTVIRYMNLPPNHPVFCTYTSHLTDQKYLIVATYRTNYTMYLHDYTTPLCSYRVHSYKAGSYERDLHRYNYDIYNISTAVYGYSFTLTPYFTMPNMLFVVTAETEEEAKSLLRSVHDNRPDHDYLFCPYKNCAESTGIYPECRENWQPCSHEYKDGDATCDLLSHGPYHKCFDKAHHCYNSRVDVCDGFHDCDNQYDELSCPYIDTVDVKSFTFEKVLSIWFILLAIYALYRYFTMPGGLRRSIAFKQG